MVTTKHISAIVATVATVVFLFLYGLSDRSSQLARAVNTISDQIHQVAGTLNLHHTLITERVIDLPEDGQTWSTVFVWPQNREQCPTSRRLASHFASEPRLQSLLAQTRVHHYHPEDPLFRERYAARMGVTTPQVWILAPDDNPSHGTACYWSSGSAIPVSPRQMAEAIVAAIRRCRPRPTPVSPVSPSTPQIPQIDPVDPVDDAYPIWYWIAPILAGGAGYGVRWRRSI